MQVAAAAGCEGPRVEEEVSKAASARRYIVSASARRPCWAWDRPILFRLAGVKREGGSEEARDSNEVK